MSSQDESLKVDLTRLLPLPSKVQEKKQDATIKYEKFIKDEKTRNNWKYFLQKSLMNVANDLLQNDQERTDLVNERDLMKIIDKRTQVPQQLKNSGEEEL